MYYAPTGLARSGLAHAQRARALGASAFKLSFESLIALLICL